MNEQTHITDWIQTYSGEQFFYDNIDPESINILDIAVALTRECRYGGHATIFYSVAEHSVHVYDHLVAQGYDAHTCFAGLMHDATEAYCKDIMRPLKKLIAREYDPIEQAVWEAIADKFGIDRDLPEAVKWADNAVLLAEKEQIMRPGPRWSITGEPAKVWITGWMPDDVAKQRFLGVFWSAWHARDAEKLRMGAAA